MADDIKPTWASKFKKKEGINPLKGQEIHDADLWKTKMEVGDEKVQERIKETSKLMEKASKAPKINKTDKTATPPTKDM